MSFLGQILTGIIPLHPTQSPFAPVGSRLLPHAVVSLRAAPNTSPIQVSCMPVSHCLQISISRHGSSLLRPSRHQAWSSKRPSRIESPVFPLGPRWEVSSAECLSKAISLCPCLKGNQALWRNLPSSFVPDEALFIFYHIICYK